ncbi:MAG: UxaA family hydrolase [Sciscionella sp.]
MTDSGTGAVEPILRLHADDMVGIARRELAAGEPLTIDGRGFTVATDVPYGHKVALVDIASGCPVTKYGQVIGKATADVAAGTHVHTHNLAMSDFVRTSDRNAEIRPVQTLPIERQATFQGIIRPDGQIATRNYIGILTTVNCSATVSRRIADYFSLSGALDEFSNVDGVVALTHATGCGMAGAGEGFDVLRRTLAGYAQHPNFAALVVLGLGCEVNQVGALTRSFDLPDSVPLTSMTIQDLGGTKKTIEQGIARIKQLLPTVNAIHRQPVPASKLVLGLNCGGSDGWSGVTANPALGVAADLLVRNGGTTILAETPEIYGAEHLLTARAISQDVADKLLARIRWWESYAAQAGGSMDNNPSPGNKVGGLTTILEKSLGAVAKGGQSPLMGVFEYAERVDRSGFVFMDTPGFDPVSVTGIVAGGANVVCFTTGRGSAFGAKPVPSIKLATNSDMYHRMADDMDINCGVILDGERSVQEMGEDIFQFILNTASGRQSKSEELGYGAEEFTPWQLGTVM